MSRFLAFAALIAALAAGAIAQPAGKTETVASCFSTHAVAMSLAKNGVAECGAVVALAKCIATTGDASAQGTVDQIVAHHNCNPDNAPTSPQLTTEQNHLHLSVDEGKDVKFFRYRREETSVWTLKKQQDELVSGQSSLGDQITAIEKKVDDAGKATSAELQSIKEGLVSDVTKLSKDLSDKQAASDAKVIKSVGGIEASMKTLSDQLTASVKKQLDDATTSFDKKMKEVSEDVKKLKEVAGDCNYVTHWKNKEGKCVAFTNCEITDPKASYVDGWRAGEKPYKSFIWKQGTKTSDVVCAHTSRHRWYRLDDHVYFWAVPWPKWKFPKYTEAALTNVCHMAGLRPWRDQGAWECDRYQYVCDMWGYNLGGHDLLNKMRCRVGAGNCHGHSGQQTINRDQMGDDLTRMGFDNNNKQYRMVLKQYHSNFYDTTPCWMDFELKSNKQLHYKRGYSCGQREIVPDFTLCAYTHN